MCAVPSGAAFWVDDCSGAVASEVGGFRAWAVVSSNKLIASLVYLALQCGTDARL